MRTILSGLAFVATASALTLSGAAQAQDAPFAGQIKARQGIMMYRAIQLGTLGAMAKGEVDYDAAAAQKAADNLLSAVTIDTSMLWPAGSDSAADPTSTALPDLWAALTLARVEVPISRIIGPKLAELNLKGEARQIAFHMALLSDAYEAQAAAAKPRSDSDRLLIDVARGLVTAARTKDPREQAVIDGFTTAELPPRLATLVDEDRLGEAILRAITLLTEGASGDLDQVTDALALFRSVGLEDTARRAALEFLILDRRG